jgi:hypothetical protein
MPLYIDAKYINLVSNRLERFQWKKPTLAACRCPVCGDSSKTKSKVRFYFYEKGGEFFVRCHNCDYSTTLGGFLKRMDGNLHRQYCFETLRDRNDRGYQRETEKPKPKKIVLPENEVLEDIPCLSDLPSSHPAVEWATSRMLPKDRLSLLYYAENFAEFISKIDPEANVGDDPRVVIPIFTHTGALTGAQGRTLTRTGGGGREIRYITIKADKSGGRMWYGLERVNKDEPIIVVEGPIDSLFLKNGVAMLGLSDPLNVPVGLPTDKLVYALDNEPRNKQVVEAMEALVDAGRAVCIWDVRVNGIKDINDMIKKGFKAGEIESLIRQNAHTGLSAKLAINRWKRV